MSQTPAEYENELLRAALREIYEAFPDCAMIGQILEENRELTDAD